MNLLRKMLRHYLLFSIIVFSISVPVFYFMVQHLWIADLDETLVYQKEKIIEGIQKHDLNLAEVLTFTKTASNLDLEVFIKPTNSFPGIKDTIYYIDYYDEHRGHIEPFRVLQSTIKVNDQPYSLVIKKDLVENEDLIRAIVYTQSILFLLLLAGVFLLNNYHAKKTWLPFYKTLSKLKSFAIDKEENFVTEPSDITEFKELNDSVLRLTENNIRIFRTQKEFTENAAHETQTPLAVIKSQIDLLTQDEDLSSKQKEIITRIDKNLRGLTKLNRNLLLLSKIENKQYNDKEPLEVQIVLSGIIQAFEEQVKLSGISLSVNYKERAVITTNVFLFQSLVTNLLANAVKYNIPNGALGITLIHSGLEITNTGYNKPLPADKIYQRFYRNSESAESSGLGLAIAKQICDFLNFKLEYHYLKSGMHQFKVTF